MIVGQRPLAGAEASKECREEAPVSLLESRRRRLEVAVFEVLDRVQGDMGLSTYRVSYLARCLIHELRYDGVIS